MFPVDDFFMRSVWFFTFQNLRFDGRSISLVIENCQPFPKPIYSSSETSVITPRKGMSYLTNKDYFSTPHKSITIILLAVEYSQSAVLELEYSYKHSIWTN